MTKDIPAFEQAEYQAPLGKKNLRPISTDRVQDSDKKRSAKKRSSMKKAFILSEIFKMKDEI